MLLKGFIKCGAFIALFAIGLLWQLAYAATAIPVTVEIEPNNNPDQANKRQGREDDSSAS